MTHEFFSTEPKCKVMNICDVISINDTLNRQQKIGSDQTAHEREKVGEGDYNC